MQKKLRPLSLTGFLLFCCSSFAQGWFMNLRNTPFVTNSGRETIQFLGYNVSKDSIYTAVRINKSTTAGDYIVLHNSKGDLLDYYLIPTLETKDGNQYSRFLFTASNLAYHTFYDYPQNEIIECVNLKTKKVEWSKTGYALRDCISGLDSTYSDILCVAPNGDYEFIDKKTGIILNTISADSLNALIGSFGQRDSVYEVSRIAGNDSVQYFQGFKQMPDGSNNLIQAKYEKACNCITADREIDKNWLWKPLYGFTEPSYTIYRSNRAPGDSIFNASIRMFNFSGDTIINKNITGPAMLEEDGTWSEPSVSVFRNFDESFMIQSGIARNGFHLGIPEYQGGNRFLFFNSNANLVNESEAFFLKYFSKYSAFSQGLGQTSFAIRADSTSIVAFSSGRDLFSTIGFVNFNSDGISPLSPDNFTIKKHTIQVYPNPVTLFLSIAIGPNERVLAVKVFSLKGEVVKVVNLPQSTSIDFSDLPIGLYELEIDTTFGVSSFKIVKN
jgi:hypothetical protein